MSAPKYPHITEPLKIRGFTLKNRLEASNSLPHFLQGPEPYPAESVISHYANKARSAGIVTCMGINNFTRGKQMPMDLDFGHFPDFDLYDTNCQNYLLQLADNIHYFDSIACMAIFVGPPSAYPLMRVKKGTMERTVSAFEQTGENLGQVASQTAEALIVTNQAVQLPVMRPLIAMDKVDIMDKAREIDTYETSIQPFEDCCTVFLPKHPVTKPKLERILKSESALDVEKLVDEAVASEEIIEIYPAGSGQ